MFMTRPGVDNLVQVDLELRPTDDGGWSWSGTLAAQGGFCPHGEIFTGESLDKAAKKLLGEVLPDADIDSGRPRTFTSLGVNLVCEGALAGPDEDKDGALPFTIGDPGDGVLARLPGDIHLYQKDRTSAFQILPMAQEITVRISLMDMAAVRIPQAVAVENAAGRFAVSARVVDGRLIYRRAVSLTGAGSWPELRAVLLEARDDAHRRLVLKSGGDS